MKDAIDINIAGKSYPLQVSKEEKEIVLLAADKINETFAQLGSKYAVKDSRDLLAMTALRVVSELLENNNAVNVKHEEEMLDEINSSLESLIN
ncbi:MAG: cell division protein ZapA [Flavobacteriales bacterium]|nr:cell division protein ZapA [Flavobacteriales bacterium]